MINFLTLDLHHRFLSLLLLAVCCCSGNILGEEVFLESCLVFDLISSLSQLSSLYLIEGEDIFGDLSSYHHNLGQNGVWQGEEHDDVVNDDP